MLFESGVKCLVRISQSTPDSIYDKQNSNHILNCLVLQKKKYSKAKVIAYIKFVIAIVFVICTIIVSIKKDNVMEASLSMTAVLLIVINKYIDDYIEKIKKSAAEVQQYVDATLYSEVMGIPIQMWGYLPKEELIAESLDASPTAYDKVRNWYSDYSSLSEEEQVLRCQSENIRWNSNLLHKYRLMLFVVFGVITVITVGVILYNSPQVVDCLCAIAWIIPLIEYVYSSCCTINNAEFAERELEGRFKTLELQLLDPEFKIDKCNLIEIQRAIYTSRANGFMIPDFFYRLFKEKMQNTEDEIARLYKVKNRKF